MLKSKLYARIVKSVTSIDETARYMPKHPTPDSQKQNKPGLGGLVLSKYTTAYENATAFEI